MKHYLNQIERSIIKNWESPALQDLQGEVAYTYGEMAQQVVRMCILYEKIGLRKGDRIAICGRNCSNWAIAYLSAAVYGAVVVSILPDFTSESIHELVTHSEAKVLYVGAWVRGRIELEKMPQVDTFIAISDLSIMQSRQPINPEILQSVFTERYPNGMTPMDIDFQLPDFNDVALINYTSGSTGSPKGVMLTNKNLSSNVQFGQDRIPNHPGLTIVSMLPLAHMFGLMFELLYQLAGGTTVYFMTKSLTPSLLISSFKQVKPYMILTVPLVIEKIFRKSIFPALEKPFIKVLWKTPLLNLIVRRKVKQKLMDTFGGQLQILIIGGAALNKDVEKALRKIRFPYTCGYGMTECAPIVCYEYWNKYAFGSCGKIVDRMELKIDSENPRKVEGEVLVKGDNVMRGYYKNLQATDNIFTSDGWMRTGDIGVVDRKGNLFLRGRSKNMILGASGQNIYPEEIEDKLNSMDGVAESVVVERDGKLIGLVFPEFALVDWEKAKQIMQENLQKVNKILPSFSRLSDIEIVKKEFEKTPKRSIKRFLYK